MARYLDQTGVSTLWSKIKEKFVLKDGNKVLSTNDYTTAEKDVYKRQVSEKEYEE